MQNIILASTLLATAFAAPTPETKPYPDTNTYVLSGFHASKGRFSDINSYSFNLTLNENGQNPYTTTCSGTSSTLPVFSYLEQTPCGDAAVAFSWTTVAASEANGYGHYQLTIKDNAGRSGTKLWPASALISSPSGPTDPNPEAHIDSPESFTIERQLPTY